VRIVIACGGTGGHFYPGSVLGKTLLSRGHEVLFLLRKDDPSGERLAGDDLPFAELDLGGMPRKAGLDLASFALRLAACTRTAWNILRAWRPRAAVGMGGYLTAPLAAAAAMRRVPLVLHESNAILGLANRACLPLARFLACGLPLGRVPSRVPARLTGTPVRPELWTRLDAREARRDLGLSPDKTTLLVFGGSQGARSLNRTVPAAAARLASGGLDFQVLHLSGRGSSEETQALYQKAGFPRAAVMPYLGGMLRAYSAADLALCRSGAATLAELAAQRLAAVLVPYPHAAAGHQEANARAFEAAGAARVILEPLEEEALARVLAPLLCDAGPRRRMSEAYSALRLPPPQSSAEALAGLVLEAAA
jgi:UDP-N-acetylglucosamine--N-acetylmuramyl-(pentapeptide) pyrophosphoryl-undecaprenol N-acetylglucosamine transferase